jgi:hypothetical protein
VMRPPSEAPRIPRRMEAGDWRKRNLKSFIGQACSGTSNEDIPRREEK